MSRNPITFTWQLHIVAIFRRKIIIVAFHHVYNMSLKINLNDFFYIFFLAMNVWSCKHPNSSRIHGYNPYHYVTVHTGPYVWRYKQKRRTKQKTT